MSEDFKENFFREEEEKLDYDDSAFYYFSFAILTIFLVPYTLYALSQMLYGEKKGTLRGKNCQCSHCKSVLEERKVYY